MMMIEWIVCDKICDDVIDRLKDGVMAIEIDR